MLASFLSLLTAEAAEPQASLSTSSGRLETVMAFDGSMPTGVAVSREGRIFVNFPRWEDPTPFTVAELKNGVVSPYPTAQINQLDADHPGDTFVSVQSVVVDPQNRLWVLDTGGINFNPVIPNAAKLVGIDLLNNQVFKVIAFPADVALATTYLNDVRFDLRKETAGVAYLTDSSDKGPNAIIVVDLASGRSRRLLDKHYSVRAESNFVPTVDGSPLMQRPPGKPAQPITSGADGIAISADGTRLFYCALASHHLYSVSTDALLNEQLTPAQVAATVRNEGVKPASDGLETDAQGGVYATDYEHNAILRRSRNGIYEKVAADPQLVWPDSMCLASDKYLYVTANQLCRGPRFHEGKDLRVKPYYLFRIRVDASPVLLGESLITQQGNQAP